MSYLSQRVIVPFIREHPVVGGLGIAAIALLMMIDSYRTASRVEVLRLATPVTGTISGIAQASSIPPRWDRDVQLQDGTTARIRVGKVHLALVQQGSNVTVLLPGGSPDGAILEAQRPKAKSITLGPVHVTSLFFVGLAMLAFGVFLAVAGKRFPMAAT